MGWTVAIVPAAGRGDRLGAGAPKALRHLAGAPLLAHAVRGLAAASCVRLVVVAAPPTDAPAVRDLLAHHVPGVDTVVVPGGVSRTASVAAALAALPPQADVVLVHDAARPLTPPALIDAVEAAVREGADAVVPGLPVPDTIKMVDEAGSVLGTPPRAALRAVQTPQGFRRYVLDRAYAQVAESAEEATDDAGLVERLGVQVRVIPGDAAAFKITRPLDLTLAEVLCARSISADAAP
jgi:2-C-methyl-D-erythritol 4-phosphate cytidylyltransferase